jgi:hypothetical protein
LTINHVVWESEFETTSTYFVLEELLDWFNEFELEIFGQTAYVVVALHALSCLSTTFNDIGVDSTLAEEVDTFELASFFFEHTDEFATDDLTLFFRICYIFKFGQETFCSIYIDEISAELVAEHFYDIFRFALAHQTVVDVYAVELLTDSLDEQSGNDRAVNAAGEGQKHLLVAYLTAYQFDLVCNKVLHVPVGFALALIKNKGLELLAQLVVAAGELGELEYGDAEGFYVVTGKNLLAVDDVVLAVVEDDTLNVGQSREFVFGDVVGVDLAVYAKCSDNTGKARIVFAAKVENENHVLLHKLIDLSIISF